jgi:hypothetical protein
VNHDLHRRRLVPLVLELLEPAEAAAVQAHLETCDDCRARVAALHARWPAGEAGHPPVRALEQLARSPDDFTRFERGLIDRHLRACAACAEEAAALRVEAGARVVALPARPRRRGIAGWAVATLAAAAALVLVVQRGGEPMRPAPPAMAPAPDTAGPGAAASPPAPPVEPAPRVAALVRLAAPHRGVADTTLLVLRPGEASLRVELPLLVPPDTRLTLRVLDAAGGEVLREQRRFADVLAPRGWVFDAARLPDGRYTIEATPDAAPGDTVGVRARTYEVRVVRRGP